MGSNAKEVDLHKPSVRYVRFAGYLYGVPIFVDAEDFKLFERYVPNPDTGLLWTEEKFDG